MISKKKTNNRWLMDDVYVPDWRLTGNSWALRLTGSRISLHNSMLPSPSTPTYTNGICWLEWLPHGGLDIERNSANVQSRFLVVVAGSDPKRLIRCRLMRRRPAQRSGVTASCVPTATRLMAYLSRPSNAQLYSDTASWNLSLQRTRPVRQELAQA